MRCTKGLRPIHDTPSVSPEKEGKRELNDPETSQQQLLQLFVNCRSVAGQQVRHLNVKRRCADL